VAWTAPATWSNGSVPTAADLNAQLRDNLLLLKTSLTDSGKLAALSSSYVANLSGTNLTGVALLAAANSYTAGRQDLSEARVVLPVGADKGSDPGDLWVEGDDLHYFDEGGTEYRYQGVSVGACVGTVGSLWVDDDAAIHYVDASGVERKCPSTSALHVDGAAFDGSLWDEGDYFHWTYLLGAEYEGHADAHTDGTVHTDTSYSDHNDVAHADVSHADVGHGDYAYSDHTDHTDSPVHADVGGYSDHNDAAYQDTAHDDTTHSDHTDNAHADHSDHGDVAHQDQPVLV
jgi:hypothetical protein